MELNWRQLGVFFVDSLFYFFEDNIQRKGFRLIKEITGKLCECWSEYLKN